MPILGGVGGLKAAACWDYRGATVVYTSETPSGALLEMMLHLEAFILLRENRKNNQRKRGRFLVQDGIHPE